MKNYSSKKCSKGKTAYRTPSVFRSLAARKNKYNKAGRGKRKFQERRSGS